MRKSYYIGSRIRSLKNCNWIDILLTALYWIVFAFGLLLSLYYLLRCYIGVSSAVQEMCKYSDLGATHSLWYYLDKENIYTDLLPILLVTAQLLVYVIVCRRGEYQATSWIGILYFLTMSAFHLCLYMHANSLDLPSIPVQNEAERMVKLYHSFANRSLTQPFLYLSVYLLYVWKYHRNPVTGEITLS